MKILHVVRQFHPSVGGMESVVAALCDRLRRRGHECEVVTLRRIWNDRALLPAIVGEHLLKGVPEHLGSLAGARASEQIEREEYDGSVHFWPVICSS